MKKLSTLILLLITVQGFSQQFFHSNNGREVKKISSTLLTGLNSYWKLDETSGNAIDAVAAYTGTKSGTVTQNVSGKINTCYSFSASAPGNVDCGTIFSSSVFSFSCWIYRDASGHTDPIISGANAGSNYVSFHVGSDNKLYLWKEGYGPLYQSAGTIPATTWTHVVVSYDAAGLAKFYINGTLNDSGTDLQSLTWGNIVFGVWNGGYLDGRLDEIAIFNKVVTAAEVTELNNAGAGKSHPF